MEIEKDFFEIIGSKYTEREVPSFDQGNWKSMKAKIDASRASKKRTVLYIASISLLLLIGGITAFYEWNNEKGRTNAIPVSSSVKTNSKEAAINSTNNSKASSTLLSASNPKITNNSYLTDKKIDEKASTVKQLQSGHIVADNSIHHNVAKQIRHKARLNNQVISSSSNISFNSNNQISTNQSVVQNNMVSDKKEAVNAPLVMQRAYPAPNSLMPKTIVSEKIANKVDSTTTAEKLPPRFSDEPRIFRGKTNIFSVELGAEYSFGWQIGSVVQGAGFNEFVGMGYAHYLGSGLFLKAGMQFSAFNNMNTLSYKYQHSTGNVVYDSAITTKRLYFLRIPAQLEYSVGNQKRSSIGLGGSVWFLIGNSGYATTYQQIDNNPPVNIVQHSQNASLNEYSKVNASIHLLYRYTFSHKVSVYAIWYFEATNMKSTSFFGDGIIHRTNGPQAIISYSL